MLRVVGLLLAALSFYLMLGVIVGREPSHPTHDALISFLTVGDFGKQHRPIASLFEGQLAVSADLAAEDLAHPVDAVVFLGDNFYMRGLREDELVERISMNLAYPYCRFVELKGSRSSEIKSACPLEETMGTTRPIYSLLGNHDLGTPGSADLQRDVVPEFISNWSLSTDTAVVRELGHGMSVILFNSELAPLRTEQRHELADALKAAKGPWRILATHRPMVIGKYGNVPDEEDGSAPFQRFVEAAIEEAGVKIQLYLSGHHHSLQVLSGGGPFGPGLHVIVGSGARLRSIDERHPARLFGASQLGFARVDLVANGEPERLVVSMFKSPPIPLLRFGGPKRVGVWSIDRVGTFERIE